MTAIIWKHDCIQSLTKLASSLLYQSTGLSFKPLDLVPVASLLAGKASRQNQHWR